MEIADAGRNGAPEEIRTPDPQIRSLVLYPAELRARETAGLWEKPARDGGIASLRGGYWQGFFPLYARCAPAKAASSARMRTASSTALMRNATSARIGRPSASGTTATSAATIA